MYKAIAEFLHITLPMLGLCICETVILTPTIACADHPAVP